MFILKVYNIDSSYTDIDEARSSYFLKSPNPRLRLLILSRKALFQHTLRSALAAGWIWKGCKTNIIIPDPTRWGWIRSTESSVRYYANWQDGGFDINNVFVVCGCKSNKCNRCKCSQTFLQCIEFCGCQRKCS